MSNPISEINLTSVATAGGWKEDHRRARALGWALFWLFAAGVGGGMLCEFLKDKGWMERGPADVLWLAVFVLPAMVNLIVAHLRWTSWPCPRCGRPFRAKWFYGNAFTSRCLHCGLPKESRRAG